MDSDLHKACKNNDLNVVKYLFLKMLFQLNVSVLNRDGLSPLHLAAQHCGPEIIRILIKNGCNMDQFSKGNKTALHYSIIYNKFDNTKLLFDMGAKLKWNDELMEIYLLDSHIEQCNMTALILLHMTKQNINEFSQIDAVYGRKFNIQMESIKRMLNNYVHLDPYNKINIFDFLFINVRNIYLTNFNLKMPNRNNKLDKYYDELYRNKLNEIEQLHIETCLKD